MADLKLLANHTIRSLLWESNPTQLSMVVFSISIVLPVVRFQEVDQDSIGIFNPTGEFSAAGPGGSGQSGESELRFVI